VLEVVDEPAERDGTSLRTPSPRALVLRWRGQGAVVVLACLVVAGFIGVSHFGTKSNLISIVQSQAFVGMAAVGMTWIVMSGNFVDLSVPAVILVAANVTLKLGGTSVVLAVVTPLAIAVVIGITNGWLVGGAGLNPVIATLGIAAIVSGLFLLTTNGSTSVGHQNALARFASAQPLGVPVPAFVFVGLIIVNQIVLARTRFGKVVRFQGNNPSAGRAVGVRPQSIVVACFVLSALMAGVAGILLGASSGFAAFQTGAGYDFEALAAVIVGGTLLSGGVGSFGRTLAGVLVIAAAQNIALLLGLSQAAQLLVTGIIFITVVAFDAATSREGR
jgi:ribose transport system permease protein